MRRQIRAGIRPSLLAFKQAEEIRQRLGNVMMDIVRIKTTGDRDKTTPLSFRENSDFFTDQLELALLNGDIDAAIHSAKDLEENIPKELVIIAMTKSISPRDCLVSRDHRTLQTLPKGARVGTSSPSRKEGMLRYRNDLIAQDIRGNVDERLAQLDQGKFDAIIVAEAALIRLGIRHRISQLIPENIIQPHPLQGRLSIQIRKDRNDLRQIFEGLNEN